jgi:hypothetical protein
MSGGSGTWRRKRRQNPLLGWTQEPLADAPFDAGRVYVLERVDSLALVQGRALARVTQEFQSTGGGVPGTSLGSAIP